MWMLEPRLKCEHCGTRLEEWDPKEGGDRHAYIPQVYTCPGCSVSGDALEAAQKQAQASKGGGHGLRVRLLPRYVVDKMVKSRTPAQRRRMQEMEEQRLADERGQNAGENPQPRKATSLGGRGRPPPIDAKKSLSEAPDPPAE